MYAAGRYLAVFTSNKTSPKWRVWRQMTAAERAAADAVGMAALEAWNAAHRDAIVYAGDGLGPTKRVADDGVTDIVNELTVFVVVRADNHDAAARLFEAHPHMTVFPCDAVEVMPGGDPARWLPASLARRRRRTPMAHGPRPRSKLVRLRLSEPTSSWPPRISSWMGEEGGA